MAGQLRTAGTFKAKKIVAKLLKYSLLDIFLDCLYSFWIVWTDSRLSGQFLNYRDSFWIVQKVLDHPDIFSIVRTVSILFGQFLNCFSIVWAVFELSRKLDYPSSF